MKLTPILVVETIEPSLAFWEERLGFERTIEVPHGDRLGFVAVERDGCEVMIQTIASMEDDVPAVVPEPGDSILYLEVEDLDAIERALEGAEIVIPRRTTFYGAKEIYVREPGGNVVGFAEFAGGGADASG